MRQIYLACIIPIVLGGCISIDKEQSSYNQVVVKRHMSSGSDAQALQLARNYCANYSKDAGLITVEQPSFMRTEYYKYTYSCFDKAAVSASIERTDDQKCVSFGAVKGSSDYINCRLKLQEMRNQSNNTVYSSSQSPNDRKLENQILLDSASKMINPPKPAPSLPKTCSVVGGIMRCW